MTRARTPADDAWDELSAHFGNPRTRTERTQFGRVVAELMEAGATVEEIRKACLYVKKTFDNPSVFAVPKWFSISLQAEEKKSVQQTEIEKLRRVQ